VLAKTVMRQSLIESPDRQYETALTETRHMLDQLRTAGAVAAAAAGAALLLALIALVVALL
jgi:dihydroxyacetone kinase-like predicted kinase